MTSSPIWLERTELLINKENLEKFVDSLEDKKKIKELKRKLHENMNNPLVKIKEDEIKKLLTRYMYI